ncbi:hypothetical protein NQZ68_022213 [Dissostichus eleginoides]|nr:hypothetical protein NQZ68_022213 [Dissostichus eleginoides]
MQILPHILPLFYVTPGVCTAADGLLSNLLMYGAVQDNGFGWKKHENPVLRLSLPASSLLQCAVTPSIVVSSQRNRFLLCSGPADSSLHR